MATFGVGPNPYIEGNRMSELIYEASVYSRTVAYKNFKGEENTVVLYFALDPLQLMQVIATFQPKKIKSGNPARQGQTAEITDEEQLKFVRDLATRAAGSPSEDGESWEKFEDFADTLAGKAFLTKLTSSDGDRKEFASKVILDPFRAFVAFAKADTSNTPKDVQQFEQMLSQMENIFKTPEPRDESLEERRARLAAEMAALDETAGPAEGTQNPQPLPPTS
jgi:hypothetical protein